MHPNGIHGLYPEEKVNVKKELGFQEMLGKTQELVAEIRDASCCISQSLFGSVNESPREPVVLDCAHSVLMSIVEELHTVNAILTEVRARL